MNVSSILTVVLRQTKQGSKLARAKHREDRQHDQFVALCKSVEREYKQQEMLAAHREHRKNKKV